MLDDKSDLDSGCSTPSNTPENSIHQFSPKVSVQTNSLLITDIKFGDGRNHGNNDFDRWIREKGFEEALFEVEGVPNPYAVSFNVSHDKTGADTRWYSDLKHGSTIPNRKDGSLHSGHHKIYISGAKYNDPNDKNPPKSWNLRITPTQAHKVRSITLGDGRDSPDWDVDRYGGEEYLYFDITNIPEPNKVIFNMSHNKVGSDTRWYTGITNGKVFKHRSKNHRIYASGAKYYGKTEPGVSQFTAHLKAVKNFPIVSVPDDQKKALLAKYSPKVWFDKDERFFPSSVEFSYPHLVRELRDGKYCLKTKEALDKPSSTLPYFSGDLNGAPIYSFWVEKEDLSIDLIYFMYFPYNRGKEVVNTIFGNHVGDWEHFTLKLSTRINSQGEAELFPDLAYFSSHDFGEAIPYLQIEKEDDHPVIYSAQGSHGIWKNKGDHKYKSLPRLVDICSQGTAWDTWKKIQTFVYNSASQTGHSLEGDDWPTWMRTDFDSTLPGRNSKDPAAGAIYRWGNPHRSSVLGYFRLEDGPTGPVSKNFMKKNTFG